MNAPQKTPSAMAPGSASGRTMPASLPPSSIVTRFTVSAEDLMIALPVAVDPVNMILSTSGWDTSAAPTSPPPHTTVSAPSGRTSLSTDTIARTHSGVYSDGFTTTVFPILNDGATCHIVIIIGQFHGPIAPTTPSGR